MWHQLERTFLRSIGKQSLESLATIPTLMTQRFLITVGGDQLTGKSTLSRDLVDTSQVQSIVSGSIAQRSTGQTMRDLAADKGVDIGELSHLLASNTNKDDNDEGSTSIVDINLDYKTCQIIMGKHERDASMLILEGRQPAVMASYCTEQLSVNQLPFRVYLKCSVREQALRYVSREVSETARQEVEKYLPPGDDDQLLSMESVLDRITGQPFAGHDQIVAGFRANMDRDADDKKRFDLLYGEECHYRNEQFYDLIVDTTNIGPQDKVQMVADGWLEWLVENNFGSKLVST